MVQLNEGLDLYHLFGITIQ